MFISVQQVARRSLLHVDPNIHKQILLTDLHTFSYSISWVNLLNDQKQFLFGDHFQLLILVTFSVDYVLILWGEISC